MGWPVREEVLKTDDDALQVEAFKRFLLSGDWDSEGKTWTFRTDYDSYRFASGELSAKDYLYLKSKKRKKRKT